MARSREKLTFTFTKSTFTSSAFFPPVSIQKFRMILIINYDYISKEN
jgi:hypothetical protein